MFRNLELNYFEQVDSNTIHIEKRTFINSPTIIKESDKIDETAKIHIEIYTDLRDEQIVSVEDKNNQTITNYYVINNNNRLMLKKAKYPITRIFVCKTNMIITGDKINEKDIEYLINRKFKIEYNHKDLYIPHKQNISDFDPINEKEILGEVTNSFEDNNDDYDFYLDFFGCDMRDCDTIEDNILDWLKI